MMKKFFRFLGFILISFLVLSVPLETRAAVVGESETELLVSEASKEAVLLEERVVEEKTVEENITEPRDEETRGRLESVLEKQEFKGGMLDPLKYLVRVGVARGIPASTIVLILIMPMLATIIAILHYWVGVTGFGTFMPTMVAITFVAIGVTGGLALFATTLLISLAAAYGLRKVRLHYWTRRSISLLFISLGTFFLMMISSFWGGTDLTKISIFPVLIMILLSEEFVRTQLIKSDAEARRLTLGTLVLAILASLLMSWRWLQEMVLLNPEGTLVIVVGVNLVVGKYTGYRLMEHRRFGKAIRDKVKKKK
jgi:hypothetical protein